MFPQNRLVVVKPAEMIHWKQLTLEYMTEESGDPEDDSVIEWRSESAALCGMCLSTHNFIEEFM